MIDVPGGAVEVRSGGLEVRGLTSRVLMDVERMLAWRQALHVQLDLHSMGGFRENGGFHNLPLFVSYFNSKPVLLRGASEPLHHQNPPCANGQTQRPLDSFH